MRKTKTKAKRAKRSGSDRPTFPRSSKPDPEIGFQESLNALRIVNDQTCLIEIRESLRVIRDTCARLAVEWAVVRAELCKNEEWHKVIHKDPNAPVFEAMLNDVLRHGGVK